MKKTEPFTVPSLAEADAEYGALADRYLALSHELALVTREATELEADIRARPAPNIRAGIAELLGEVVDKSLLERPQKLRELRGRAADLEAAAEIIRRRRDDRLGAASVAACGLVKSEYGKRIAAFAQALQAAKDAHDHADELLDALEREDVRTGYMPALRSVYFMGKDGPHARFVAEAKAAGYVR